MSPTTFWASRVAASGPSLVRTTIFSVVVFCSIALAIATTATRASAAFNILDYKLTPSTLQAGGHPNIHYHVDPDAVLADLSGDDLKSFVLDFPAGLLGNPESAIPKCSAAQFAADTCPGSSQIGTMKTIFRLTNGNRLTANGTVYVLTPSDPGAAATFGFIVRPSGYRKVQLKTQVNGAVAVRSGSEADYGLTLTLDNIPRTLTNSKGVVSNVTINDITVDTKARSGSKANGPYFAFNPTRCTPAVSHATSTSYQGVVVVNTGSFTPAGCASVPFAPTATAAPLSTASGAATGWSATFGVPTADAAIQSSHVKSIAVDLPNGTMINWSAINSVPALCTEPELNADQCPAGSKIGAVAVNVPFLPPELTGDIYMISRTNNVVFGYILRGAGGVKAPLLGNIVAYDAEPDGQADFIRTSALNMPQIPWSTATINFTTEMAINPSTCTGTHTVTSTLTGWSGAGATRTNQTSCPAPTITYPANGAVISAASVNVFYTQPTGGPWTCSPANGASHPLAMGANTITILCTDPAGNTSSSSVTVTRVLPLTVTITSPQNGAMLSGAPTTVVTYTVTGATGAVTCNIPSGGSVSLFSGNNNITINCTDSIGATGSASVTVFYERAQVIVTITSPTNNSVTAASSVAVTYTAYVASGTPTCNIPSGSTVNLVAGNNAITINCTDIYGTVGTATVNVFRDNTLPVVSITNPLNGALTALSTVTVTYTATDNQDSSLACVITNNGTVVANPVPVAFGTNTIVVSCTDNAGNVGSATSVLTRDYEPYVLIASPANNLVTSASSVIVTYTVGLPETEPYTCNIANGASVALLQGNNTITVTCSNASGLSGTATTNVFRDNTFPVVTITSPLNGAVTASSTVTVTFTATDNQDSSLACVITNNGTVVTNPVPVAFGTNTIVVSCTDNAGNVGSATSVLTRD